MADLIANPLRAGTTQLIAAGSAFALATALVTQFGFGYAPCELCIWQRWPYVVAIVLGIVGWKVRSRADATAFVLVGVTLAVMIDAGIAGFHVGVEQGWWQGLAGCGASGGADSLDDLRAQIMAAPLVRCTDVAITVLGLSMAAWNGLFAAGLAFLGLRAILKG